MTTALEKQFGKPEQAEITAAIAAAEKKTSAEIVPVIAEASGRYDRAEDVAGLWLGLILLAITWALYPPVEMAEGSWAAGHPVQQLVAFLLVTLIGFLIGASLASQFNGLRRLFTPADQMADEVWLKARAMFFDQRVHHTAGATGVMIYVSLFEHRAVIIADQKILDQLGQDRLNVLCNEMTSGFRTSGIIPSMKSTIDQLGEELGKVLPRETDDVNELSDALILLS